MTVSTADLVSTLVQTLTDNKGQDICEMNLAGITDVAEYVVVCSATSNRHANTLTDYCWVAGKELGAEPLGKEGTEDGEWILIDFGNVIVHIMLPAIREYYELEDLWCKKPRSTTDED